MSFKELDVYQRSYKLALKVHDISLKIPKELQFDLADQLRRSSRSVSANIAEGYSRGKSNKDVVNFLRTALGSNDETLFHIGFSRDVQAIQKNIADNLLAEYEVVGKQLNKLIQRFI